MKRKLEDSSEEASKRPKLDSSHDAKNRDHYNSLKSLQLGSERARSRIGGLRDYNNLVKRALLVSNLKRGQTVLDLCSGKGGDLPKLRLVRPALVVLSDHARDSVLESKRRHTGGQFPATFYVADSHKPWVHATLPQDVLFDLVSCQFALHYAFKNETALRGLLRNVADRLKVGGRFVGTTVDATALVKLFKRSEPAAGPAVYAAKNDVFSATFTETSFHAACRAVEGKAEETFGISYTFTLEEAIDSLPEFLVCMTTLKRIAAEYGLVLEYSQNMLAYKPTARVGGHLKPMSSAEAQVAGLYLVFLFRRVSGYTPPEPRTEEREEGV